MKDRTKRWVSLMLAVVYYVGICVVSHFNRSMMASIAPDMWDKLLHALAYFGLSVLVARGLTPSGATLKECALRFLATVAVIATLG